MLFCSQDAQLLASGIARMDAEEAAKEAAGYFQSQIHWNFWTETTHILSNSIINQSINQSTGLLLGVF